MSDFQPGDVLVISPLAVEARALRSAARGLRMRTTGMGPAKARAAVPVLLEDPAAGLLVVGFGGGLAADSRLCEVVVADTAIEIDGEGRAVGESIPCAGARALRERLAGLGLCTRGGSVGSVREIVTGETRERMLASGAVAVDTESAWLAQAARGRPFAVVRVLSDTPEHELRQRLPVGPPLPSIANSLRALSTLRRLGAALGRIGRDGDLHTVLGVNVGESEQKSRIGGR